MARKNKQKVQVFVKINFLPVEVKAGRREVKHSVHLSSDRQHWQPQAAPQGRARSSMLTTTPRQTRSQASLSYVMHAQFLTQTHVR